MIPRIFTGPARAALRLLPILYFGSLAACLPPPAAIEVRDPSRTARVASQVGIASWYGPGFHGLTTASGTVYDQHDFTAAHPTLPMGSRVTVTNLENGRSIEVAINDRGPFVQGRIIDLSYAAANALDMVGQGTTPVRVELVPGSGEELQGIPSRLAYTLQVGSFVEIQNALELKDTLVNNYSWAEPVSVVPFQGGDSVFYRVQLGTFTERHDAERHGQELARDGFPAMVMENWDRSPSAALQPPHF